MAKPFFYQHVFYQDFDFFPGPGAFLPPTGSLLLGVAPSVLDSLVRVRLNATFIMTMIHDSAGTNPYEPLWWADIQANFGLWCDGGLGTAPPAFPATSAAVPSFVSLDSGTPNLVINPTPPFGIDHEEYLICSFNGGRTIESEAFRPAKSGGPAQRLYAVWNFQAGFSVIMQNAVDRNTTSWNGGYASVDALWRRPI